ncbi:Adenosylcobinamide-phosphate synthase [hydrothermal vent metagenome]|uniref:Adenosylcobinamide-phosphate synthase n=1 Tax=hydrothermal vent metagenome TaxID=652676 RepID=A0A3B1BUU1_9ZZZZ
MSLPLEIACAALLDLAIGDPVWRFHPVRLIGTFIERLETVSRRAINSEKIAGAVTVLITVTVVAAVVVIFVKAAESVSPVLGVLASIFVIYTTLSARDLADHATAVFKALDSGEIEKARELTGRIVGRDTGSLDERGVARAATESVAENCVDGVTAPLIYAFLFGPTGAMVYKAINTMDSTFGYKNEKYINFGWASARLDDLANYIPARITVFFIVTASMITRLNYRQALTIAIRDGRNHLSPNSGLSEAAFAGALGLQLGGEVTYHGKPKSAPLIGDPNETLTARHITSAVSLMYATLAVAFMALATTSYIFF